ncbi:MAG: cyclopropane-fatty-acyl-phospholipid synthase [Streptomyces sp.]|nr:cyclopropane-fatty-acyl-phospholipid synthase [Streptomyces sp.]
MSETRSPYSVGTRTHTTAGIAERLTDAIETAFGVAFPLALRAWDGSRSGPWDGPVFVLRSERAFRHVLWRPGELGLARAYVTGAVDIDGDFQEGLRRITAFGRQVHDAGGRSVTGLSSLLALLVRLGALGPPPRVPREEARLHGRLHTTGRDQAAIAHHYDLGNDFYAAVLDPAMAYSCGYWTSGAADYRVADAQRDKLDLVCRKLALRPGATLLDVGCGWGSLILHAAEVYGVRATGVTVSAEQLRYVKDRIAERGLGDLVDVRHQDYRKVAGGPYDAVASIEMGEHVGDRNYPGYCGVLRDRLRPGGRLFLQQMARGAGAPGGGAFIESYIAPDMSMRPLHRTVGHLEQAGFEVREVTSVREHYVRTIEAWLHELDESWAEMLRRFGSHRARIWRLYLAGSALAFEANRMSVHQLLAVRTPLDGDSGMPPTGDGYGAARGDAGAGSATEGTGSGSASGDAGSGSAADS